MSGRSGVHARQRGVAIMELAVLVPVILLICLATVDLGRLIYMRQVLTNLSREAANLVSRGATPDSTFAATFLADEPLDLEANGTIIISLVRRHDPDDAAPWIFEQDTTGELYGYSSKVGSLGGPAHIPGMDALRDGVTIMAVEMFHTYEPLFRLEGFGLDPYPEVVYEAAFF